MCTPQPLLRTGSVCGSTPSGRRKYVTGLSVEPHTRSEIVIDRRCLALQNSWGYSDVPAVKVDGHGSEWPGPACSPRRCRFHRRYLRSQNDDSPDRDHSSRNYRCDCWTSLQVATKDHRRLRRREVSGHKCEGGRQGRDY
jgi:hypothetical protein